MRALCVRSWWAVLLAITVLLALVPLGTAGSAASSAARVQASPDAQRSDAENQILAVIADSARTYQSAECDAARPDFFPDQPPYAHFSVEDRVITLATLDELTAYCRQMKQGRVSAEEAIQSQTVHMLTPDVGYVVTRSVQTTRWEDERVQVLPTMETAIVSRQDGRWRIVYRHLSWASAAPGD